MEVVVVFVEVVEVEDVGVVGGGEVVEDFGFFVEAVAVGGVGEEAFVDGFAGEGVAAGDGGETAVDDAESAAADLFAQLVIFV